MFELHDVVILKRTIPEIPVPAGSVGTIVHVHDADPQAYLVEFPDAVDDDGWTLTGRRRWGSILRTPLTWWKAITPGRMLEHVAKAEQQLATLPHEGGRYLAGPGG